jgi:trehalose/maltose transport system substrate-binding protein
MTRLLSILVLIVLCVLSPVHAQQGDDFPCPEGEVELSVAAGDVGQELEQTLLILDEYRNHCPNVTINASQPPDLANDRLGYYNTQLDMGSADIDIYQIDVTWPGTFADHFVNFYDYISPESETIQQHFSTIIENNTVDGRLVGLPWFTDAGLLYYRTDLLEKYDLEVPQTWDQLEQASAIIQRGEREAGNSSFWGYVWQGRASEAITTNALEWQASQGGGTIISSDGEVQVNNPETAAAMTRAREWIGWISPPSIDEFTPGESLQLWQEGNAAFMRNWPFAYSISNDPQVSNVAGMFDITQLPGNTPELRTGTLGGWQLAVSRYSEDVEAAVMLAEYMTSSEAQKLRAEEAGLLPTIDALYEDEEILAEAPFLTAMREILQNATPRPSTIAGDHYGEVSTFYYEAISEILYEDGDPEDILEDLEFDLQTFIDEKGIGTAGETYIDAQSGDGTTETVIINSTPVEVQQPVFVGQTEHDDDLEEELIIALVGGILLIGGISAYFIVRRQQPNKATRDA